MSKKNFDCCLLCEKMRRLKCFSSATAIILVGGEEHKEKLEDNK